MWETTVNGRELHFHLAGINNQNFIMRDEETGSWWQQVTGEAIQGPLKGERLRAVFHDELTFGLWKQENSQGRILRPDPAIAQVGRYATADWEQKMTGVPVATSRLDKTLAPRTLVVGLSLSGKKKAYPFDVVVRQSPILDELGDEPILIVIGEDGKSVRAFQRTIAGRKLEFFLKAERSPWRLADAETGSEWDFTGRATSGALLNYQLTRVPVLMDYWFDWKAYNPGTTIYDLGLVK